MQIKVSHIVQAVILVVALTIGWSSVYSVDEGHVGIIKRFGEAIVQTNPGIHMKMPFVDEVVELEVRTRKNVEKMASATNEQMPVSVEVSVNWTVAKESALELYKKYGGLEQFEQRILDPRFRSATKDIIPQFKAEELIQNRATAINQIKDAFIAAMNEFDVTIDNIQIENIILPAPYLKSIETKQTEKNLADAEKHKLARQNLEAQQKVNTAKATAEGIEVIAAAEAKSIEIKGAAEATAIKAKAEALKNNPLIVALTEAQVWNGAMPTSVTIMGENSDGALPIIHMNK